jgi:hypothetical protein
MSAVLPGAEAFTSVSDAVATSVPEAVATSVPEAVATGRRLNLGSRPV